LGILLHFSIAVSMGLWSFAFSMWAGIMLLCLPIGADISVSGRRIILSPQTMPSSELVKEEV